MGTGSDDSHERDSALPPYAYVPGVHPHPRRDSAGHSFGRPEPSALPLNDSPWPENRAWLLGLELYRAGYFWEAHEQWEALWHAEERRGDAARLLAALIQCAAAALKNGESLARARRILLAKASTAIENLAARYPEGLLGLDLKQLSEELTASLEGGTPAGMPRLQDQD